MRQEIEYSKDQAMRLDLFLTESFKEHGLSRSYWNNMVTGNYVLVAGESAKSGYKLTSGDHVSIDWPQVDTSYSERVGIIHEDDDIIVLNKPAGMLTHSKGAFNPEFTVADFIASRVNFGEDPASTNQRLGIVHRLDRFTSGVIVAAKRKKALDYMQKQFQDRVVEKHYLAVAEGKLIESVVKVEGAIARDPKNPKTFMVDQDGKPAETLITPISHNDGMQILLLQPFTGRTHQLRVHLSQLGSPIVADTLYGAQERNSPRFLLHAYSLKLRLPSGQSEHFIAEVPSDMSSYISDDDAKTVTKLINSI